MYLEELRLNNAEAYKELVTKRARPFGAEPAQPLHTCVEHLVSILVCVVTFGGTQEVSAAEMRGWMDRVRIVGDEDRGAANRQQM